MPLTNEEFLEIAKVFISKWAELSCKEINDDLERNLDVFESTYLRALYTKRIDALVKIGDHLEKTNDDNKKIELINEVFGEQLELPANKLKFDIKNRIDWLKKCKAKEFEREFKKTINFHNITSPIEQIFLMEWNFGEYGKKLEVELKPQKSIITKEGKYVVDFLLIHKKLKTSVVNVVIELDGHEFHEKTKIQVARDKKRDRALIKQGLTVLRFSGSEIFYNINSCIKEIADFIKSKEIKP